MILINKLVKENRTIAEKIHDAIVSFLNKLNKYTGYKNEKLFWQDIEKKYAQALKTSYSNETKNRRELTKQQRKAKTPESSKKNPLHPEKNEILKDYKIVKMVEPLYNVTNNVVEKGAVKLSEILDKSSKKNGKKIYDQNEEVGGFRRSNNKEELDNSSFSLQKNMMI